VALVVDEDGAEEVGGEQPILAAMAGRRGYNSGGHVVEPMAADPKSGQVHGRGGDRAVGGVQGRRGELSGRPKEDGYRGSRVDDEFDVVMDSGIDRDQHAAVAQGEGNGSGAESGGALTGRLAEVKPIGANEVVEVAEETLAQDSVDSGGAAEFDPQQFDIAGLLASGFDEHLLRGWGVTQSGNCDDFDAVIRG